MKQVNQTDAKRCEWLEQNLRRSIEFHALLLAFGLRTNWDDNTCRLFARDVPISRNAAKVTHPKPRYALLSQM
jgi:hypothetical protein